MANRAGTKILHKWQEILSIHRWVAYVLPLAVFMLVGALEPTDPQSAGYKFYPWIYLFKLLATLVAFRLVWPVLRPLLKRVGWQGVAVGVLGAVVWVGACHFQLEQKYLFPALERVGLGGWLGTASRSAFNPFERYPGNWLAIVAYLVMRGAGLIVVVPVIEEYFLRGFLMRFVAADKWWKYPIGSVTRNSAIVGTLVPMLMHPAELVAACLWFSLITLLYVRTKNLWQCIVAHGVTNLLLGAYVLWSGAWHLV